MRYVNLRRYGRKYEWPETNTKCKKKYFGSIITTVIIEENKKKSTKQSVGLEALFRHFQFLTRAHLDCRRAVGSWRAGPNPAEADQPGQNATRVVLTHSHAIEDTTCKINDGCCHGRMVYMVWFTKRRNMNWWCAVFGVQDPSGLV